MELLTTSSSKVKWEQVDVRREILWRRHEEVSQLFLLTIEAVRKFVHALARELSAGGSVVAAEMLKGE